MRHIRHFYRLLTISAFCAITLFAQTPANEEAVSINSEAGAVLAAAQRQLQALPAPAKQKLLNQAAKDLTTSTVALGNAGVKSSSDIVRVNPDKLSLSEKEALLALIQHETRVVDPNLPATPSSSTNPQDLLSAFQSTNPLDQNEVKQYSADATKIPVLARSVGRLLWQDEATGKWTFEGTVFVTKPNIVATACHVLEPITDIAGNKETLRSDRPAVVDFTDTELPASGALPQVKVYPVTGLMGVGSQTGCDVGFLKVSGADSIPSLKFSDGQHPPSRIVLIGYPELRDLTPLVCQYAIDDTMKYFCKFHSTNPGVAKIKAPGTVYTTNMHSGIAVFTYSATSRGGESGSPVIDLDTLEVVGVHYCCTGSTQPDTVLPCATWHAQNVAWNEAIASASLISDPVLNEFIEVGTQVVSLIDPPQFLQ